MNMHLLIIEGPDKDRAIIVQPGKDFMMGRAHDAYYRLHDEKASRYHCELVLEGEQVKVTCNGGDGGTRVNGMKIQEYRMSVGDLLQIGETKFKLQEGDGKPKPPPPPPPNPLLSLTGTTISHFEVGKVVGSGELSLVFLAKDKDANRTVALRVLQPEFALDDQKMQRFVSGMKTAMTLRHPNLVSIFGAGKAGKNCWMAMEQIDGENMVKAIRRIGETGEANWKYAFRMAIHIAKVLDYAHQHKIVHRNVHPKNIFFDNTQQVYKLGDFLSAKSPQAVAIDQVTQKSLLMAAMPYVSPEHTRDFTTLDARSDLYCLGAVAYALVTGQAPCDGTTFNSQVNAIREKLPDAPTALNPAVPTMFEAIVMKLLAKQPKGRYQTAAELHKDLDRMARMSGIKA